MTVCLGKVRTIILLDFLVKTEASLRALLDYPQLSSMLFSGVTKVGNSKLIFGKNIKVIDQHDIDVPEKWVINY
jgi:hypothetical protein